MHLLPHCHSYNVVWADGSILCTSPHKCHRILDLQLLLPIAINGRAPAMRSYWSKSNFQFLTAYIELTTEQCPHASAVWKLL